MARRCREAIENRCPDFSDRPFVALGLRRRGKDSSSFEARIRDAGPDENYYPAVKFLTEQGYHVVGQSETNHAVFQDIFGYYEMGDLNVPPD